MSIQWLEGFAGIPSDSQSIFYRGMAAHSVYPRSIADPMHAHTHMFVLSGYQQATFRYASDAGLISSMGDCTTTVITEVNR